MNGPPPSDITHLSHRNICHSNAYNKFFIATWGDGNAKMKEKEILWNAGEKIKKKRKRILYATEILLKEFKKNFCEGPKFQDFMRNRSYIKSRHDEALKNN